MCGLGFEGEEALELFRRLGEEGGGFGVLRWWRGRGGEGEVGDGRHCEVAQALAREGVGGESGVGWGV